MRFLSCTGLWVNLGTPPTQPNYGHKPMSSDIGDNMSDVVWTDDYLRSATLNRTVFLLSDVGSVGDGLHVRHRILIQPGSLVFPTGVK